MYWDSTLVHSQHARENHKSDALPLLLNVAHI